MKLFAVNLLAESLGRDRFLKVDPRDTEFFTKTLVYVIQREIDLASNPDKNFKSLLKDGLFGSGLGQCAQTPQSAPTPKEHIMRIELDMQLPVGGSRLQDGFEWDVTCPDNCPEHFARVLLQELSLDSLDNINAVAN